MVAYLHSHWSKIIFDAQCISLLNYLRDRNTGIWDEVSISVTGVSFIHDNWVHFLVIAAKFICVFFWFLCIHLFACHLLFIFLIFSPVDLSTLYGLVRWNVVGLIKIKLFMAKDSELSYLTETNGQKQIARTYHSVCLWRILLYFFRLLYCLCNLLILLSNSFELKLSIPLNGIMIFDFVQWCCSLWK